MEIATLLRFRGRLISIQSLKKIYRTVFEIWAIEDFEISEYLFFSNLWWSKMTILKKSSHRMTKTFWETINEHPLRVSSQYRDHPLAYIAEQGFCGRIPRAIRYDRLIVLLSTMTDWSCCTQTRRYDRLLSAMTDCTAKPDPTQHNRYPRLLYYTFWAKIEVPQGKIDQVRIQTKTCKVTHRTSI